MKKRTLGVLAAAAMLVGGLAFSSAGVVEAHTQEAAPSCEGLSVNLSNYPAPAPGDSATNDVYITMDGFTRGPIPFADAYRETFEWAKIANTHTYSVNVFSADGIGNGPFDGTFKGDCVKPSTVVVTWTLPAQYTTSKTALSDLNGYLSGSRAIFPQAKGEPSCERWGQRDTYRAKDGGDTAEQVAKLGDTLTYNEKDGPADSSLYVSHEWIDGGPCVVVPPKPDVTVERVHSCDSRFETTVITTDWKLNETTNKWESFTTEKTVKATDAEVMNCIVQVEAEIKVTPGTCDGPGSVVGIATEGVKWKNIEDEKGNVIGISAGANYGYSLTGHTNFYFEKYPETAQITGQPCATKPKDIVEVEVISAGNCDKSIVVTSTYTTVTKYVWDEKTGEYVKGTPNTTSSFDSRKMTVDELKACQGTPPVTDVPTTPEVPTPPLAEVPATDPAISAGPVLTLPGNPEVPTNSATVEAEGPTTSTAVPAPNVAAVGSLPATGNDGTGPTALLALLVTSLGGLALLVAHRRNVTS